MDKEREPGQALVVFSPSGKRGNFPLGTALLRAARDLGVDIDSICGGRARCGQCQVQVMEGSFAREGIASSAAHLSELSETERYCQHNGRLRAGNRLSCQAMIRGDLRIDVPASSQVHHQVVRKDYEAHDIELDPIIHLYFTELRAPDMATPQADLQRLSQALQDDWGLAGLEWDLDVLQSLQSALREGRWQVTVAIRNESQVVAVWPGLRERIYGAAIDVGSTTIATHLCDLASGEVLASAGAMNPQIRFGEDLMSRLSYAMLHPAGAGQMMRLVRATVNELLAQTAQSAGIGPDELLEVTLVGNPVMHHIFLGLDPTPLGIAPFSLATDGAVEELAADLDIHLHAGARTCFLPCIAGHVGADTAAVMLAETPWQEDEISLIIDVGTNAEIVLGNRERILAASSPTGPAFEGAQISGGQRAAPGAIERVRIDPDTLEPRFKVIGCDSWSDEPDFAEQLTQQLGGQLGGQLGDQAGEQGVTGICGSGIIEAIACMYLAGIISPDGLIDGANAPRSARVRRGQGSRDRTFSYLLCAGEREILVGQGDVRAIQLAKAALYAGCKLLMDRMGVATVDRIRLAGAFGSQIDVKYAMILGMIPDCALDRVSSGGNAAGTGARIALLNRAARREIEERVRQVEKVETATDENFQRHFVDAMSFPHATDAFPNLARVVRLPAPPVKAGLSGSKRRRRSCN